MGALVWILCIIGLRCYGYKVNLFILLLNLNILENLNAMQDVKIIALAMINKVAWNVIQRYNFYRIPNALNPTNVKKAIIIFLFLFI